MLERLAIKNVALIESADIEFCPGLNILSGETGSGKSVILDSLNFVLGGKADKNMIRYGADEAFVRGEFCVPAESAAVKALEGLDIECDGEVVITRRYNAEGKGAIKINGNAVNAGMLRGVTRHLVDVYGQSEHFALLSEANQLGVIDGRCPEAARLKDRLAVLISEKRECRTKLQKLGGNGYERASRLDLLSYQIKEIDAAGLVPGEEEELTAKRRIIENTEKIASSIGGALNALDSDGGCADGVSLARRMMAGVARQLGFPEELTAYAPAHYGERSVNFVATAQNICNYINNFSKIYPYSRTYIIHLTRSSHCKNTIISIHNIAYVEKISYYINITDI